jgi:hypothetical protein
MKTLLLTLFLSLSLAGFGQDDAFEMAGTKTAEVNFQDSTGFYIIHFSYNNGWCTIPATNPPGCPHYDATITVYQIQDGKKELLGEPFGGTFTDGKCYEDEPGYLVRKAKVLADPELKKRYQKEDYSDPVWDYMNKGTWLTDTLPVTDQIKAAWDSSGYLKLTIDTTATLFAGGKVLYNLADTSRVIFFCKEPGQKSGFVTYQPGYLIYHPLGGKKEYFDRYWGRIKKTVLFTVEDEEK